MICNNQGEFILFYLHGYYFVVNVNIHINMYVYSCTPVVSVEARGLCQMSLSISLLCVLGQAVLMNVGLSNLSSLAYHLH